MALAHILLHVGLCTAISRAKPSAQVAMHVSLAYPRTSDGNAFDKTFTFERGDDPETIVELDAPAGLYRMDLDAPKYGCSAASFVTIIADHDRMIATALDDAPTPPKPVMLLDGSAPTSFQYARPTFVLLDPTTACNAPIAGALPSDIAVENDRDGYYVSLHYDAATVASAPVLALRLRTPTGLHHYIRIRVAFPTWRGWPNTVRFNISEDELDSLATEKTETLLCPKLWETSVQG